MSASNTAVALRGAGALACLLTLGAPAPAQLPPPGFDLKIMADSSSPVLGGATLLTIDPYVSINDSEMIAFTGIDTQGDKAYVLEDGTVRGITFFSNGRIFDGAAINNGSPPEVASRDRLSGAPPLYYVRKWSSNTTLIPNTIANSPDNFSSGLLFVDINDSGVVAFSGLDTTSSLESILFAGDSKPPVELARYPGSVNLRPQISETNVCVIRDDQNRIVGWPYPSGTPTIATDASFTTTGRQPGISPDGSTFAFSGDRGNGEGVFVSVLATSGREIVRVAGEGLDGFSDFVEGDRVGVLASGNVITGLALSVVTNGTFNGVPGAYVVDLTVTDGAGGVNALIQPPRSVARAGDTVDGKSVTSVTLYDPFNRDGTVVLWAAFADGTHGILRGRGDRDGDGLLDVWEEQGIDVDQDGSVDLDLKALGADPDHKDLFVEIDGMAGRGPDPFGINEVVEAFRGIPNTFLNNPDGKPGIELHCTIDQTGIQLAPWPQTGTTVNSGSWPEFDAFKSQYFGTVAEQTDPNSANILAAKRMAFRYAVFADQFGGTGFSGIAEIAGNDLIVALGASNWSPLGGDWAMQAGTFMHELGHTLGLRHGGADDVNGKPNYHSIMNYLWQLPGGPLDLYWSLEYSDTPYQDLDEASLDETVGVGGPPVFDYIMTLAGPCSTACTTLVPESGKIDWNGDGDKNDTMVARDLTQNHPPYASSPGQLLNTSSHNDITSLIYDFRDSVDYADGVHATTPDPSEELSDDGYAQQLALCPEPSTYCDATVNSLGCTPQIDWNGTPSLTGADDLAITASNVRSNRWGMLVWSLQASESPFLGGTLCVDKPTLRGPSQVSSGNSANDCSGTYSFAFPQAYMLANGLQPGDNVFCQIISRDQSPSTPMGVGFTDAVAFAICQ